MHVARPAAVPTSPAPQVAAPAAAPEAVAAAPTPVAPKLAGYQTGAADALRAIGAGYGTIGDKSAAVVDAAMIYPVESVFAAGKLYKDATKNVPILKKTGFVSTALGYLATVQNMIASSLTRAPGELVNDITHAAADAIDGKQSFDRKVGIFTLGDAPAKPSRRPAPAVPDNDGALRTQ